MKILYISQYFHPEVGATTNRTAAIIKAMQSRGHEVSVLSEMPNHPHGIIFPEYRGKFIVKELFSGIPVYHLPVIANPSKNFITRIMMYLSFSISAMLFLLLKRPKYDLLYVTSPPLFSALCGILSKAIFPRRKLVFEVRDLWPDSAIQLGELNNTLLVKASLFLEKQVYHKSDLIVCATKYISQAVRKKGISPNKIFVNLNGVDDAILSSYVEKPFNAAKREFTAIFTGNMGIVLSLETIIHCAKLMQEDSIRFVFVGGGPNMHSLKQLSKSLHLTNVTFINQVPQAELGLLLASSDFGLVILKDLPFSHGILPVKMYDYMAYKLPTIAGVKGEAAEMINTAGAGIVIPPEDAAALESAIRKLMTNPDLRETIGINAREYALTHFQRTTLADQLVSEISTRFPSPK